jgi:hypothetical protein
MGELRAPGTPSLCVEVALPERSHPLVREIEIPPLRGRGVPLGSELREAASPSSVVVAGPRARPRSSARLSRVFPTRRPGERAGVPSPRPRSAFPDGGRS